MIIMCRVLKVSRSGYYAWKSRPVSRRSGSNKDLLRSIIEVHEENRKVYGSPRIHKALRSKGHMCGENRVARLMRENSIQARQHKRMKRKVKYVTTAKVDNILDRRFNVTEANKVWASDITCFWTGNGWLNLSIVMDLYSRRIIGWAMNNRMTERLSIEALEMALLNRRPKKDMIHHSDQGSQYQSTAFQEILKRHKIQPSMSRRGECHDNAVVESFFKTLKYEIDNRDHFRTREEARSVIFEYIEVFYNKKRLHSTLGYLSPQQYEMKTITNQTVH